MQNFSKATLASVFKSLLVLITLALISANARADVINIDTERLSELLAEDIAIIDVRRSEEWQQTGIVEGSHLMTFFDAQGKYDAPAWASALEKISTPDTPVILICRSGNRTSMIAKWLSETLGYSVVYNVDGGIRQWKRLGGETVQP